MLVSKISIKVKDHGLLATLGKFLRENKLLPSKNKTTYSLRYSFQDRLLAANAPDRVQADLMGHKFNRPAMVKVKALHCS